MSERNKTIALIGALVLVLLCGAAVIAAVLAGEPGDVEQTLIYIAGFALPTIAALLAAAGISVQLGGKLDEVRKNTNGKLTELTRENEELRRALAVVAQPSEPSAAAYLYPPAPQTAGDVARLTGRPAPFLGDTAPLPTYLGRHRGDEQG